MDGRAGPVLQCGRVGIDGRSADIVAIRLRGDDEDNDDKGKADFSLWFSALVSSIRRYR